MLALKRSHSLLNRTEKFSLLGTLAARLAHEIKNPMTTIETFIQMLPYQFKDNDYRENFYKLALEETSRVKELIVELFNLLKEKELHFELYELNKMIEKMVLFISPQTHAKSINIIRHFDPKIEKVCLDSEKMKRIILNILFNAVEYAPVGGEIMISTKHLYKEDIIERIQIEIKDNGPGISPLYIEKIFDPYFTTKNRNNMHSGTGLGLFIALKNVQDQGGTLEVESKINEGAKFIITLPMDTSIEYYNKKQNN